MGENRHIRPACEGDLGAILEVLDAAKRIMRASGNMHQWSDGYPSTDAVLSDLRRNAAFVVTDGETISGYFAYLPSPEPTYSYIEGGSWLDDSLPYHVVHRIASTAESHGVFSSIMEWCFAHDCNIRIDTHRDNRIMQHCIELCGFTYCGIIYLENGDERLAYQRLV